MAKLRLKLQLTWLDLGSINIFCKGMFLKKIRKCALHAEKQWRAHSPWLVEPEQSISFQMVVKKFKYYAALA